jgi:integrase
VSVGAPIPDHPELIAALPPEPIPLRVVTPEDLLDTATRLKTNASPQTRLGWVSCLKQFTDFLKHEQMQLVSREDAARYRDDMLKRLKVSTVKTRLNTLSGVFNIGVEEQLLPVNPFSGVGKRLRIEDKETKIYDISSVDALAAKKLPEDQYIVYQLLRYTGCRLAEILGIKTSDIDLPAGVIHITAHPDRPLKTKESKRVVPIHDNIRSLLERLVEGTERPFSRFYKESTQRWGGGIAWSSLINIHPHGLRHHAVSSMRAAGISERVIAKVVGHSVPGMTGQYGTVAIELLQEAVRAIA